MPKFTIDYVTVPDGQHVATKTVTAKDRAHAESHAEKNAPKRFRNRKTSLTFQITEEPQREHYCHNCKKVQALAPYTGAKLDREEQTHVFSCGTCDHIIDIDDPRNAAPADRQNGYELYKRGREIILVMNPTTADLVTDALEIINPDSSRMNARAQRLALEIKNL